MASETGTNAVKVARELAELECAHRHAEADRAVAVVMRGISLLVVLSAGIGLLFANALIGSVLLWIGVGIVGLLSLIIAAADANRAGSTIAEARKGIVERRAWLAEAGR